MRFYHMEMAVSQPETSVESTRQWITGLVVMAAAVVAFVGFSRVSVGWTLAISTLILAGLVGFLWAAGRKKQRSRR